MIKAAIVGWVLCGLMCGCGGQAERRIGESTGGSATTSGTSDTAMEQDGTELGPCVSGFSRWDPGNSGKHCNWVADDLCYETKIEACACICPRDRKSLCISGLGEEDSATVVTCD